MNSSDDEGSPEAVSLSISKKTAASKRAALHNAQTQEALKKKEKNREKDRRLKEQAASSRDDLEARMERAMQEAQEESSEEDSVAEEKGLVVLGDPVSDEEEEEEILPQKIRFDADKDEDMDSGEEPANPNHLPDHIFAAAFAQKPTPKEAKPKSIPPRNKKTPKRKKQSAKDLVLGSRTIRTLSVPLNPTAQHTVPSKKVDKFILRALNVKGNKTKDPARGWERRPANIGVMRTTGPAANFVRNS